MVLRAISPRLDRNQLGGNAGRRFDITRERVRQIEREALVRLREQSNIRDAPA